jgi:hypothetical protein
MLDTTPEFNTPYKTVCIDISAGGCFLFCVMDDIVAGSTIWIQMPGSDHESPRKTVQKAVVYWVREWGTTQNIPGIGVHFET